MQVRQKLAILLIALGVVLVLFPGAGRYSFTANPTDLSQSVFESDIYYSVDQAAAFMVGEDSTVQLIDLRPVDEYSKVAIPGSINIPFDQFFSMKPESWLFNRSVRYLFYSNDDLYSSYAVVIARGLGYDNCYAVKGGLNMWYETVMYTKFSGERISPRENALFLNRARAARFFTEINSLPDSLKIKYAESRRQAERDLDGGCE
jgi:rhodanese-related sulfurtransferase